MSIFKIDNFSKFSEKELLTILRWWSGGTQKEEYPLSETAEYLKKSFLDNAVVSIGDKIVGAAGISLQEQRIIKFFL